ncbi:MAG: glutamate mutase L [Chloroflexota bacterium]
MESALVFSLSPAVTSAYLFDKVEGRFRFVAKGSVPCLTWPDSTVVGDAAAAAGEIERLTGRSLFVVGEPVVPEGADGNGVDAIAAVCSPGNPLRVATVATTPELVRDSCMRAVETGGHTDVFSMLLNRNEPQGDGALYNAVRNLRAEQPDVVLVAGDGDGGSEARLVALATALASVEAVPGLPAPEIIYAGDSVQLSSFRQALAGRYRIHHAPRLRPSSDRERLEPVKAILSNVQVQRWCAQLPEYDRFAAWLPTPPVPNDVALGRVFRFLSASAGGPLWGVDLDRTGPGLFLVGQDSYSTYRMRAPSLVSSEAMVWLPSDASLDSCQAVLLNLRLRPSSVPATVEEASCLGAALRTACRRVFEDPRLPVAEPTMEGRLGQVIGTGPDAACAPGAAAAAMLLLDALQPLGVGSLRWDSQSVLAPIGALSELDPRVTAELAANEGPQIIGTYVAPAGALRAGVEGVHVEATYPDQTSLELEVASGSVEALPIPVGERARVSIRPAGRLDVGAGRGKRMEMDAEPSSLGIVVDARGRPIYLPSDEAARRELISGNLRRLGYGAMREEAS